MASRSAGHLQDATLLALLRGAPTSLEAGAHFARCWRCQARLVHLAPKDGAALVRSVAPSRSLTASVSSPRLEALLELACREIEHAKLLLGELVRARDPEKMLEKSTLSPLSVGAAIVEEAVTLRQGDIQGLERLLSVVLERLAPEVSAETVGSPAWDLVTQLEAERANALRIAGAFARAKAPMEKALNLARLSFDKAVRARVRWLGACYLRDVRQFDDAEALGASALRLFEESELGPETDRTRFTLATIDQCRGRFAAAKEALREMMKNGIRDPLTELAAVQLAARISMREGSYWEASPLLPRLRTLGERWRESPRIQADIAWVRGVILGGVGSVEAALPILEEVRSLYADEQIFFDAALASVDLAFFQLYAGQPTKAATTALEAVQLFETEKVKYPQAFAAIRLFEEAVRTEKLQQDHYRRLIRSLDIARHDPGSRLAPGDSDGE